MNNFVKNRSKNVKEFIIFNRIPILIDNPLTNNIILSDIIKKIEGVTHRNYFQGISKVRIGNYEFLNDRDINATLHDGTLYLSNMQDNDADIIDDIFHEVGHNIEKNYHSEIYGDKKLEEEFLLKRSKLKRILQNNGLNVDKYDFFEIEYNQEFDKLLYKDLTYFSLNQLAANLFCSVYGATSLSEYYASGFETYLMGDEKCLKDLSPILYRKINKLTHLLAEK